MSIRYFTETLYVRGIGELALLSSFPSSVVVIFAVVTQLADPWFVFSLLGSLYIWPREGFQRRASARLLALTLVATALLVTLKVAIAVPRPPGASVATTPGWLPWPLSEVFLRVAADDGFGFPSGHATGATVLYGGLAALLDWRRRRERVAIATVVILAVMLSRIVLGLHFLVDVLAGGVLGAAILWFGLRWGKPTHWFGIATIVAVAGGVITALQGHATEGYDVAMVLGSATGGIGGWHLTSQTERTQTAVVRPVTGVLIASIAGGSWTVAYLFGEPRSEFFRIADVIPLLASTTIAAVAVGFVVGLPAILLRWEQREQ